MKDIKDIDDVRASIAKLRKHLEEASYLISYLESDLDKADVYRYVDTAMYDIKLSYDELLDYIDTLERDLDDVVEEDEEA